MPAWTSLALLLVACEPGAIQVDGLDAEPGTGWVDSPWAGPTDTETESPDLSEWEGARIEVTSPEAGEFIEWRSVTPFRAWIVSAQETLLELEDVEWSSDQDPNWFETGPSFDTDALPIGTHAFTATATLPTGAVLQHTVGGVLVQHAYGGTYTGLLDVDGTILNVPVSCVGVTLVVVDATGTTGTGDGDCIVSLLGLDLPLHYIYDLEIDEAGVVGGTAGADLLGLFTYNFPAEGTLDPNNGGLDLVFNGEVPLMGPLNGSTTAERVGLETEF